MRTTRIALALVVNLALTSGCTKRQAGIGVGVGLGIALSGAVVGSTVRHGEYLGIGISGLGGAVVLGSLLGMAAGPSAWGPPPAARLDVEAPAQAAARRRAEARELTRRAIELARDDKCRTVSQLGPKVRTLDSNVHATVFLADIDIKRCLAPAPPLIDPAPAPQNPSPIVPLQP